MIGPRGARCTGTGEGPPVRTRRFQETRPGAESGVTAWRAPRWSAERRARSAERAAPPEAQMDGNIRCVARPHGTVAPFRRSASPYFLEAKAWWLWSAKLGRGCVAGMRTRAPSAPAIAGEGDHWSSRSERTVVEGAQDSELRCRCWTVKADKIESLGTSNDSSSSKSVLNLALSKLRCCLRPLHRPSGGPPPPLSRGRMESATALRCDYRGSRRPKA
jgi:hypothetical protein